MGTRGPNEDGESEDSSSEDIDDDDDDKGSDDHEHHVDLAPEENLPQTRVGWIINHCIMLEGDENSNPLQMDLL